MNLILDVKINIAINNLHSWIKLYIIDDEFKIFTLSKSGIAMFINIFQKKIKARNIKRDNILMINNNLCVLSEISYSKTVKNGNCRMIIIGRSIFNEQRHERLDMSKNDINVYW